MHIGQPLLAKKDGKIVECIVIKLFDEDILLEFEGIQFTRKFWEIHKIEEKNDL
jgi:hypothetical protein